MRIEHWRYSLPLWLRGLLRRRDVERDIDDELRDHIERQIAQNVSAGMTIDEARRAALVALRRRRAHQGREPRRAPTVAHRQSRSAPLRRTIAEPRARLHHRDRRDNRARRWCGQRDVHVRRRGAAPIVAVPRQRSLGRRLARLPGDEHAARAAGAWYVRRVPSAGHVVRVDRRVQRRCGCRHVEQRNARSRARGHGLCVGIDLLDAACAPADRSTCSTTRMRCTARHASS